MILNPELIPFSTTVSLSVHHLENWVQNLSESRLLSAESLLGLQKLFGPALFGWDCEGISHDCGRIFHFVNWHYSCIRWRNLTFCNLHVVQWRTGAHEWIIWLPLVLERFGEKRISRTISKNEKKVVWEISNKFFQLLFRRP